MHDRHYVINKILTKANELLTNYKQPNRHFLELIILAVNNDTKERDELHNIIQEFVVTVPGLKNYGNVLLKERRNYIKVIDNYSKESSTISSNEVFSMG